MRSRTPRTRVWRRWVKSPSALTAGTENARMTTEGHPGSPLDGIITRGACTEPMALEAFQDGRASTTPAKQDLPAADLIVVDHLSAPGVVP